MSLMELLEKHQLNVRGFIDDEIKRTNDENALVTFYEVSAWIPSTSEYADNGYLLFGGEYYYFKSFLTANEVAKKMEKEFCGRKDVRTKLIRIQGTKKEIFKKEELIGSSL